MECTVCFGTVRATDTAVRCKTRTCTAIMCLACITEYLEFAVAEKHIPKCVCNTFYVLSDLPPGLAAKYGQCCLADLVAKHGDTVRKRWETQNVLAELRLARLTFLTQRFPPAIAYTAQVTMPQKLRALDKQFVERTKQIVLSAKRVCMNLTCNGSLDENLTCMTCHTIFCNDCEKVKGVGHVCDPNDVESVRAIRQFVRCPQCGLPIQRSQGCNFMTCANCHQDFNYGTGEAADYGNHGQNTPIPAQMTGRRLLSVVHQTRITELGLTDLVVQFEAAAPKPVDTTVLTNVLMLYYKNQQVATPEIESELARAFERYMLSAHTQHRYQSAASELERKLVARTLRQDDVLALLVLLGRPV